MIDVNFVFSAFFLDDWKQVMGSQPNVIETVIPSSLLGVPKIGVTSSIDLLSYSKIYVL